MEKYKALILDMDGTLLDSRQMHIKAFTLMAEESGIRLTEEHYRSFFGSSLNDLLEKVGFPDPPRAAARWRQLMENAPATPLFDGVAEVLAAPLRRGVVTSQVGAQLQRNLAQLQLPPCFECTVCADDTPYQKPHPHPLLYCLEQMRLDTSQALFVGDSLFDYGCATAAGVDFGLALWGTEAEMNLPQARYIFRRPEDMLAVVEALPE